MGFPSPATDYVEKRLSIDDLLIRHPSATLILDDGANRYVIDKSLTPKQGSTIYFELHGELQLGKLMGQSAITPDGEAYEGSVMEDVVVIGVVTAVITRMHEPDRPTI
ncbi:S24/S26 family peptidase [Winslowiella arboricola]|uniref:phage repressor protein n=1 Tax=Winslowiella arboricola TaxID=2978220 RepID=UPI00225E38FA|nr:phage repressor protein [Winslowiella arboricola]MCU5775244.1 phage repressor protein [Winslowiella arboricola]